MLCCITTGDTDLIVTPATTDHCKIQLYTSAGKCVASYTFARDREPVIHRRSDEFESFSKLLKFSNPIRYCLCFARIVVLLLMTTQISSSPMRFIKGYWVAFILDLLTR